MKKLYFLSLALGLSLMSNAQYDLSISLDNHTSGQATSENPLNMDFTITNNGITVAAGDSIYWAFVINSDYYATDDLAPGFVMFTKLSAAFVNGASFSIDAMDMGMAWIYGELGLTGNVCAAVLGVNANSAGVTDILLANNMMCVNYTVTSVAGIGGNESVAISVYPNPAVSTINFQLNNNEVDLIKIFDISGREITALQVSSALESVNTENFEAGVYFYQIINNGTILKTDKFTVAK